METITNVSVPMVPKSKGQVQLPLPRSSAETNPLPKPRQTEGSIDQKLAQLDAKRLERLNQAANSFALGDQRFTIYKDTTGQFITRFTSLRDGKVTYLPEPTLTTWLSQSGRGTAELSNVSLDV